MPIRLPSAQRVCASLPFCSALRHARLRLDRHGLPRGQSMTEYLVALAVLVAVLASANAGDPSAFQLLLDSVRTGWTRLLSALALPV
ncbi:MAG TPA: hypothetical protein VM937_11740 [Burkholderiaceae bacterium]|jgi:hypothetical protein|nr:hypothetical protein [Burkholderiaceae bacterium]